MMSRKPSIPRGLTAGTVVMVIVFFPLPTFFNSTFYPTPGERVAMSVAAGLVTFVVASRGLSRADSDDPPA
jgi:hypothetical protein